MKHKCKSCGSYINNFFEKCVKCGYLNKNKHLCKKCGITKAGYSDWKKINKKFKLILNKEVLFEGYKHQCLEYLKDNLIADEDNKSIRAMFKGDTFISNIKGKKYVNNTK
ncbi:MAG: hypothetical protein RSE41_08930 [Clostridia bacterium]